MKIWKIDRKVQKMFLIFYKIAFDIVPSDSKYNRENTCDRQSMFS